MRAGVIILKTMRRPKKERGLAITRPDIYLSEGHMKMANFSRGEKKQKTLGNTNHKLINVIIC